MVIGLISLLSVVTLREDFAGAGGDPGALGMAGRTLVAFHEWTRILGPQFCAGFGNGILLGYLMYKSGLVPPRMALLGLIGGPLAFAGGTAVLFGALEAGSPGLFLLTALEILWEASLTICLIVNGFRPSPILPDDPRSIPQMSSSAVSCSTWATAAPDGNRPGPGARQLPSLAGTRPRV